MKKDIATDTHTDMDMDMDITTTMENWKPLNLTVKSYTLNQSVPTMQ
jgi:hypothetical protein